MKSSENKTIFFSWQSDLSRETNHYAIKDCIQEIIKETNLSYEEATRGESGSINILSAIFDKICVADIVVCDITTVGVIQNPQSRPTPNPNVLLELGYAIANLGWERIILVYNKKFVNEKFPNYSDLPFDISKHRITGYLVDNKNDKDGKAKLFNTLKTAVGAILENNPVKNADIIRDVREGKGKRAKDVENLVWLLKRVSLQAFDTFRENLPIKLYMPVVHFFAVCITYCYNNSLFHIHNSELKARIDDFCLSLSVICQLGGLLHYPGHVHQHILDDPEHGYNKGTGFYFLHEESGDVRKQFENECSRFESAYQRLIPYIRDYYTLEEIDMDKLSVDAHNAFIEFLEDGFQAA